MRRAETVATPETECLLYATYWFRPLLSELIGAATESATVNRDRAPLRPSQSSGVSALLVWFPASWACKVAPFHRRCWRCYATATRSDDPVPYPGIGKRTAR